MRRERPQQWRLRVNHRPTRSGSVMWASMQRSRRDAGRAAAPVGRQGYGLQALAPLRPPWAPLTATPSPCRTGSVTRISNSELAGTCGAGLSGQPGGCVGDCHRRPVRCPLRAIQRRCTCCAGWLEGEQADGRIGSRARHSACEPPSQPAAHPVAPRPGLPARGAGRFLHGSIGVHAEHISDAQRSGGLQHQALGIAPPYAMHTAGCQSPTPLRPSLLHPTPLTTVLCSTTLW